MHSTQNFNCLGNTKRCADVTTVEHSNIIIEFKNTDNDSSKKENLEMMKSRRSRPIKSTMQTLSTILDHPKMDATVDPSSMQ